MSQFGALTDHFSMATADLILIDSKIEDDPLSRADAQDENGDIAAATWFGNTAKALKTASCTYALKSGTVSLSTFVLGEIATGVFVESINPSTSNSDWPKVEVSGKLGTETITNDAGKTYTLPTLSLSGIKRAQEMGFTTGAGCRLTASSFSGSVDLAQVEDGLGEPAAHGVSGGVGEGSADFVGITTAPTWTVDLADATETKAPGEAEPQAAYHTGSGTYEIILERGI